MLIYKSKSIRFEEIGENLGIYTDCGGYNLVDHLTVLQSRGYTIQNEDGSHSLHPEFLKYVPMLEKFLADVSKIEKNQ
jgi:hypothetical protein